MDVDPTDWATLDSWWDAYRARPIGRRATSGGVFDGESLTDHWVTMDAWWDTYAVTGHATAADIADLLCRSNDAWARSDAPFDTDPLAADLSSGRFRHGPLQPDEEVEWSQWLARLLSPSAALVVDLFDVDADEAPDEVLRENQLTKADGFRRADLLVLCGDSGVSIEVKLGDTNYAKTAETAALVERHHDDRTWNHVLLLPKRKQGWLESVVDVPVVDGRIEWDDPGAVHVIHWRDVTAALRSLLRRGVIADDHWAANAYLFCAVAEQQIIGFQPQPVVKKLTASEDIINTLRPIMLADTLEAQLTYLRERVET